MNERETILTGIKPTGRVHVGQEAGVIRPTLELLEKSTEGEKLVFVADLHSINQDQGPKDLKENSIGIAATWLALGLDLERTHLYRQSRVPEVGLITTFISAVTPKGDAERAHAYKAAVQKNEQLGNLPDRGVNMGLYTYPILMASDIIATRATTVPIGSDQKQHLEFAKKTVNRLNNKYGLKLTTPNDYIVKEVAKVPGIDGEKMSKSHGNGIPIFATDREWESIIRKIKTTSAEVGVSVPDFGDTVVGQILKAVADEEFYNSIHNEMISGTGSWKFAKEALLEALRRRYGVVRDNYNGWVESPERILEIYKQGEDHVQTISKEVYLQLLNASGLGDPF